MPCFKRCLLFIIAFCQLLHAEQRPKAFYYNVSGHVPAEDLLMYDYGVLALEGAPDLTEAKALGHQFTARVAMPDKFAEWNVVAEKAVAGAKKHGFNGVCLEFLADGTGAEKSFRESFLSIRKSWPAGKVWIAGSPFINGSFQAIADGVVIHASVPKWENPPPSGNLIFSVGTAANAASADVVAEAWQKLGILPCVLEEGAPGRILGPRTLAARRILVIYGWNEKESEKRAFYPIDTLASSRWQMPLEWLGYETDYHDVARGEVPSDNACRDIAGIIWDENLEVPYASEAAFVTWLIAQKDRGVKILFTGNLDLHHESELARLREAFHFGAGSAAGRLDQLPKITKIDEAMMNFEAPVKPMPGDFPNLKAPPDANVSLSLEQAGGAQFDPVFTCSWGGALLNPYVSYQPSAEDAFSLVDPFAFLSRIWPQDAFPAPDPSTRQGLRVFSSHIDGDGFTTLSNMSRGMLSAEIIRDHILKKHPWPVTVSVVESDIEALLKDQSETDRERYRAVAKSLLELPNVQAGTHTYSHPFYWIADDPEGVGVYEHRNLVFRDPKLYPDISYEREITGSISYMEKMLLPPGKKVEAVLWSGNCRPPHEALQICSRIGVENMNGGSTRISGRHPSLSAISPRVAWWGNSLQVLSPNQNEFLYTGYWNGPFYGGFTGLTDTFERTETPRRLKPVNLYYHFYSGSHISSLRALEKICAWISSKELHPMTTAEICKSTRDSCMSRIYNLGPRQFAIVAGDQAREFRFSKTAGVPQLSRCTGVTGWNIEREWIFVHTDGRRLVELTMGDIPEPGLHFSSSNGYFTMREFSPDLVVGDVKGWTNGNVTFAGAEAGSKWEWNVPPLAATSVAADANGVLTLPVSASAQNCRLVRQK